LRIQLAILVSIELLGEEVILLADQPVAIQVEGDVGRRLSLLLQGVK
jgi:hypothetical protein